MTYTTVALDGLAVTLTLAHASDGGVRVVLSSPNAHLQAEPDGTHRLVPQRQGGEPIPYCSTCGQPRPSDTPDGAPCPLCVKHGFAR